MPEHVVLLHVEPVLAAVAEEAVEVAAVEVAAVEVEDVVVEASSIEVAVASLQYSACITGPDPLTVPDCFGISHFFRRLWWQEAEMDHVEAENCAMDQLDLLCFKHKTKSYKPFTVLLEWKLCCILKVLM